MMKQFNNFSKHFEKGVRKNEVTYQTILLILALLLLYYMIYYCLAGTKPTSMLVGDYNLIIIEHCLIIMRLSFCDIIP